MNIRKMMTLTGATLFLAASIPVMADNHGDKDMGDGMQEDMHNDKNIVDTAAAAGQFDTLVTAVQAAGLVDTLSGKGPFTVFAPTDEAFAKIPEADLNALLTDKAALTDVLTYHVVAGKVMAADVVDLSKAETVQGSAVEISVDGDTVMIDDAKVIKTDITASNGVIHVIDTVIMP